MSGKSVVQRVVKQIDWDYLAKVVISDEGRRELGSLRRSFDDVSNTLETKFNTKETTIDWEFYKQKLNHTVVNIFKDSFDSLDVPEYEDKFTPDYKAKYEQMLTKAAQLEEESKQEIVRLDKEIEKVKRQKEGFRHQTVDDYFKENPQVKEEIDEEIRQQYWG